MSQTHSSSSDSASRMRTRVPSPSTRNVSASDSTAAASINGRPYQVAGGRIGLLPEANAIAMLQRDYDRDGPWSVDALRRAVPETFGAWLETPAPRRPTDEIEALVAHINPGFW